MTIKPPRGSAAGGLPRSDEETIDDSLDKILLEAHEKPLENPLHEQPAPVVPRLQMPRPGSGTLLGLPIDALPLPGSARAAGPGTPTPTSSSDEVTQIAARPSLLDEANEEATKVEPVETAKRVAAFKAKAALALNDQAIAEREKALRKTVPLGSMVPPRPSSPEFADPVSYDDSGLAHDTPASPVSFQDDDGEESTANGRAPVVGANSGSSSPTASPRLPPPAGRPELFAGVRLPTPSTGLLPGGGLGAPSSTTLFGHSLSGALAAAQAAAPSPYAGGARAITPSVPIPAPSGLPAAVGGPSAVFRKVQLPLGGLVAFLVAAFCGGLLVGALFGRGEGVAATAAPAVQPAPQPPPPAIVQPVPAQQAPAQPEDQPEDRSDEPAAGAAAERPGAQPAAPGDPDWAPPGGSAFYERPARKPTPPAAAAAPAAPRPPKPRKPAPKPAESRGAAKGWVDPFAQ